MQVPLPIFILCLLVHTGIYLTSGRKDRKRRMYAGIALVLLTWPVYYGGLLLEQDERLLAHWLGRFLLLVPYYLPFLSFLVYLRSKRLLR